MNDLCRYDDMLEIRNELSLGLIYGGLEWREEKEEALQDDIIDLNKEAFYANGN